MPADENFRLFFNLRSVVVWVLIRVFGKAPEILSCFGMVVSETLLRVELFSAKVEKGLELWVTEINLAMVPTAIAQKGQ